MNDVQRLARRRAEAGLVIQLAIEQTEPLAGTASTHGAAPVTFAGWLDLLRALSELMCAAGQPTEDGTGRSSTRASTNGRLP